MPLNRFKIEVWIPRHFCIASFFKVVGVPMDRNVVSVYGGGSLGDSKFISVSVFSEKNSLSFDGVRGSAIIPGAIKGKIFYFEKWVSQPEIIDEI